MSVVQKDLKTSQDCNHPREVTSASMKKYIFLCILSVLTLVPLYVWLIGYSSPAVSLSDNSEQRNVTILLWHWTAERVRAISQNMCWERFNIPHCKVMMQEALYMKADVVVFHNLELSTGRLKLPLELPRPPGQRWAWMSIQSPDNNGRLLVEYGGVFNLTVNYRRDADVSIPYGGFVPREFGDPVDDIPMEKTDLVCWVVSHYKDSFRRSQVYEELNAVIPVKVYGRWSNNPLEPKDLLPTISRCYFYLAFENSIAKDYITEKLWINSYQSGAVPVVLGPPVEEYKAVAPPYSFIHVDEFASVKELAEYLQELAGDAKRYGEYMQWKRDWKVQPSINKEWRLCQICLRYPSFPPHKVYTDLAAWDKAT
nr:alpha-(1,3)-fucosyltransferase 7-like isoform X1 [Nerophis lumbriciformis]